VRPATESDANAVLSIDGGVLGTAEHASLVSRRIESGHCLVSESEGRVLGFATVHPRSFFGRDFIELLVVDTDFRRQGVANALLGACAHRSTTPELFTSTNSSNLPMLNLLRKAQWLFSGELVGIDEGDPELVFYRSSELKLFLSQSAHETP
jgi:GNAT superfamily N-acetyltransferase